MLPEEGAGPRPPTRAGAPRPGDAAGRLAALGIWSPGLLATLAEWPLLPLVTPRGPDAAASVLCRDSGSLGLAPAQPPLSAWRWPISGQSHQVPLSAPSRLSAVTPRPQARLPGRRDNPGILEEPGRGPWLASPPCHPRCRLYPDTQSHAELAWPPCACRPA